MRSTDDFFAYLVLSMIIIRTIMVIYNKPSPSKEEILQKKLDSLENIISKEKSIQILQKKVDSLENIISKEGYYGTN